MSGMVWRRGFWWRPFGGAGFGIEWDRTVMFSERYGYRKVYRLWRLSLAIHPRDVYPKDCSK